MSGTLALIGGHAWTEGCDFDRELLEGSGANVVHVLPTAAAYERPEAHVERARAWFAALGAEVVEVAVLARPDALAPEQAEQVAGARFLYLASGSSMHLRSVLKESAVWDAICQAWAAGAVLAASSGAAMTLTDPMVDPRGGAFSLGLGLMTSMSVIAHSDVWSPEKIHRTIDLAPKGLAIATVPDRTALVRDPGGTW